MIGTLSQQIQTKTQIQQESEEQQQSMQLKLDELQNKTITLVLDMMSLLVNTNSCKQIYYFK